MKSTLPVLKTIGFTVLFSTAFFSTTTLAANSKGDALNECKSHLEGLYQDGVRSKVKRIKKRGGDFEVKLKVTADGERFNAVCAFADGNMTYTTDQASSSIAD